jgi:hypothetical protein
MIAPFGGVALSSLEIGAVTQKRHKGSYTGPRRKIKITGGIFCAPARKIPPDKLIKRQQCPTCPNIEVLGIDARELAPLVVGGAGVWGGDVLRSPLKLI